MRRKGRNSSKPFRKQEDYPVHFQRRFTCRATICKARPYRIYWKIRETV